MSTYAMVLIVIIAIAIELVPMKKKKQSKDIIALLMLGAITLAYGYYYNTHPYTASIVNLLFDLFNVE